MTRNWYTLAFLILLLSLVRGSSTLEGSRPLVIAHRGASSLAPENTMAAVYAALDLGVDMIEIDVHKTLDGELVVIHDPTVNRTTDGNGFVKKLALTELRQLDAGSWFKSSFNQERIPILREVLEAVQGKVTLIIELKAPDAELPMIKLVRELGMTHQVIIQSFDAAQIRSIKELAPEINTILLVSRPNHGSNPQAAAEWMIEIVELVGASGVAVHLNWCTPQLLNLANERKLDVYVWTVNRNSKLKKFIKAGVHGIVTDRPQNLTSFLEMVQGS